MTKNCGYFKCPRGTKVSAAVSRIQSCQETKKVDQRKKKQIILTSAFKNNLHTKSLNFRFSKVLLWLVYLLLLDKPGTRNFYEIICMTPSVPSSPYEQLLPLPTPNF